MNRNKIILSALVVTIVLATFVVPRSTVADSKVVPNHTKIKKDKNANKAFADSYFDVRF